MRVGDVNVGNVTKIERQGWHALVTMRLNGDVDLPANATAKVGQTSLLGSLHIELAPPTDVAAAGQAARRLADPAGARRRLPDHRADAGGAVAAAQRRRGRPDPGHHQGVQHRVRRSRAGPAQPDRATRQVRRPTSTTRPDDIIAATESLNSLVGQFAEQKPVLDKALETIPDALAVLKDQRDNLAEALDQLGKFSALTADFGQPNQGGPGHGAQRPWPGAGVAGQRRAALTRSLSVLATYPWPKETIDELGARRLRQPDRRHRPDAEPHRRIAVHRHPVGRRPDRAGDAVGPHHRPVQPCTEPRTPRAIRWSSPTTSTRGPDMHLHRRIRIQLAIFAVIA